MSFVFKYGNCQYYHDTCHSNITRYKPQDSSKFTSSSACFCCEGIIEIMVFPLDDNFVFGDNFFFLGDNFSQGDELLPQGEIIYQR